MSQWQQAGGSYPIKSPGGSSTGCNVNKRRSGVNGVNKGTVSERGSQAYNENTWSILDRINLQVYSANSHLDGTKHM